MLVHTTSVIKNVDPTVDTDAYTAGDVVGGIQEVQNAVSDNGMTGLLQTLTVLDEADQKAELDILLFSEEPDTSPGADDAALALDDGDLDKLLGIVNVGASDYTTLNGNAIAQVKNVGMMLKSARGKRSIWVLIVTRGTPNYDADDDLRLRLGIMQD